MLTLACPAKVNLSLAVGPPRPGDGYHPIASWMIAVDFADTLSIRPRDAGTSTFSITFADDAPVGQEVDWPLEKDLTFKAHALLEGEVGRALPVDATIRKRIPAGAGLGGGSADAAGMLVGLNRVLKLGVTDERLRTLGAGLGCDVAFAVAALQGQTAAVVTGLGERLEPVDPQPIRLVLVFPPFGCPTGPVYRAFDHGEAPAGPDEERVRRRSLDGLFNDLTEPAMLAVPALRAAHAAVAAAADRPAHLTGSGSTLFTLPGPDEDAAQLADRIADRTGFAAVAARSL